MYKLYVPRNAVGTYYVEGGQCDARFSSDVPCGQTRRTNRPRHVQFHFVLAKKAPCQLVQARGHVQCQRQNDAETAAKANLWWPRHVQPEARRVNVSPSEDCACKRCLYSRMVILAYFDHSACGSPTHDNRRDIGNLGGGFSGGDMLDNMPCLCHSFFLFFFYKKEK